MRNGPDNNDMLNDMKVLKRQKCLYEKISQYNLCKKNFLHGCQN